MKEIISSLLNSRFITTLSMIWKNASDEGTEADPSVWIFFINELLNV